MTYITLTQGLQSTGFTRVERDDRLLDVFPKETLEKGVELWENWGESTVEIVRIHNQKSKHFTIPRSRLEQALQDYRVLELT